MLATWDDHDFGQNDAGASFAFKERAERVYETCWGSSAAVRNRPGVQDSIIVGPGGKRVQIILLDTRFFRGELKSLPWSDQPRPLGNYVPSDDAAAPLLGEAQWKWLESELDKQADVRLIVSSIQLVTDAHGYEKWGNFPREWQRFYDLLATKRIDNAVILSGDWHQAAIYRQQRRRCGIRFTKSRRRRSISRSRGREKAGPSPTPRGSTGCSPRKTSGPSISIGAQGRYGCACSGATASRSPNAAWR